MIPAIKENIYNTTLITKVKKNTGSKKLKKIVENLRNLAEEDVKGSSKFKIKIFKEKIEEIKTSEFTTSSPVIVFQHYSEDLKKSNSKLIINNNSEWKKENISSTADDNEELTKQIDSSDFSDDD